MTNDRQKRHAARIPYDKELTLRADEEGTLTGFAEDISRTGFFLRIWPAADRSRLVGREVELVTSVYEEEVTFLCRVVRSQEEGVGLEFLE